VSITLPSGSIPIWEQRRGPSRCSRVKFVVKATTLRGWSCPPTIGEAGAKGGEMRAERQRGCENHSLESFRWAGSALSSGPRFLGSSGSTGVPRPDLVVHQLPSLLGRTSKLSVKRSRHRHLISRALIVKGWSSDLKGLPSRCRCHHTRQQCGFQVYDCCHVEEALRNRLKANPEPIIKAKRHTRIVIPKRPNFSHMKWPPSAIARRYSPLCA
jgi:hypothetical protein